MKIEFCDRFLKKYRNVKFHKNPSNEIRVVSCRQTDGTTDGNYPANSSFFVILLTYLKSDSSNKILCMTNTSIPFSHFEINTLLGDDPMFMAFSLYSVCWALLVFPKRHELLPHIRF